jgi:hypothetical protein
MMEEFLILHSLHHSIELIGKIRDNRYCKNQPFRLEYSTGEKHSVPLFSEALV